MALDQGIIDGVTNYNFKTNAERASQNADQWQNLTNNNAVAHQQMVNGVSMAGYAAILNRLVNLDVAEAAATAAVVRSQSGQQQQDLGSAIAGLRGMIGGAYPLHPNPQG